MICGVLPLKLSACMSMIFRASFPSRNKYRSLYHIFKNLDVPGNIRNFRFPFDIFKLFSFLFIG